MTGQAWLVRNDLKMTSQRAALEVDLGKATCPVGALVRVLDEQGNEVAHRLVGLAENWGAQTPFTAHFELRPGTYRAAVRFSDGTEKGEQVDVDGGRVTRVSFERLG